MVKIPYWHNRKLSLLQSLGAIIAPTTGALIIPPEVVKPMEVEEFSISNNEYAKLIFLLKGGVKWYYLDSGYEMIPPGETYYRDINYPPYDNKVYGKTTYIHPNLEDSFYMFVCAWPYARLEPTEPLNQPFDIVIADIGRVEENYLYVEYNCSNTACWVEVSNDGIEWNKITESEARNGANSFEKVLSFRYIKIRGMVIAEYPYITIYCLYVADPHYPLYKLCGKLSCKDNLLKTANITFLEEGFAFENLIDRNMNTYATNLNSIPGGGEELHFELDLGEYDIYIIHMSSIGETFTVYLSKDGNTWVRFSFIGENELKHFYKVVKTRYVKVATVNPRYYTMDPGTMRVYEMGIYKPVFIEDDLVADQIFEKAQRDEFVFIKAYLFRRLPIVYCEETNPDYENMVCKGGGGFVLQVI